MTPNEIEVLALDEIRREDRRAAIDAAKARIREKAARRRWWHRLFPFVITITRRD